MKKNSLSDNKISGSKGFYAALGISAVMIGGACLFAYDQGEKLTVTETAPPKSVTIQEAPVDKKYTDLPKTAPSVPQTTPPPATIPAPVQTSPQPSAEQVAKSIEAVFDTEEADPVQEILEAGVVTKMENVRPPLADISDVVNPFSGSELVKNATTGTWQTHNGTDFGAEVGTEVYAVSNGNITSVKKDAVWGVTVTLDHNNGYVTRYCGLSDDLSVQEGDHILSGDLIGLVGDTADIESSLKPHLHIEIMKNGSYLDPVKELNNR